MQDDENTFLYNPKEMHGNRFFGQWSKVLTVSNNLNIEIREKYFNDYSAYFKAKMEIGSVTHCFDECIKEVDSGSGLSSNEKNCVRECYLKRVSSREDFSMLVTQLLAKSNLKQYKETFV